MQYTYWQATTLSLVLLPIMLLFGVKGSMAQIVPKNDGTGTQIHGGQQINITHGTQFGGNLFHSFHNFNVNAGQTANFITNLNTVNVLGRVTGGNASFINGLIQVSGSNANLYLMNPAGIVFGQNASLNVPAAFTATTANAIGFGNGQWWSALGTQSYSGLTNNPISFAFSGDSGHLINAGNLVVKPEQSITLVGGTVVNTGTISTPGGNITIAAVPGEKLVRINQDGSILSLDLPTSDRTLIHSQGTISLTPLSLPELLTGGNLPAAMGVMVGNNGVVALTGGSASVAGTLSTDGIGSQNGGKVIAFADRTLNFTGTISAKGGELGGNGGFVDISGKGQIKIEPNAKVVTTAARGLMGNWVIDPAHLTVVPTGGATIDSDGNNDPATSTIGAGTIATALNSSHVELKADHSITVDAAIDASGNTNPGHLSLNTQTINLNQVIKLQENSQLSGTATTVKVGSGGSVQNGVDVAAAGATVNLAATTYTLDKTVNIDRDVTLAGTGAQTTTINGDQKVGVFYIESANVTLEKMSIVNGQAPLGGGIDNNGGTVTINNSTLKNNTAKGTSGSFDSGAGGGIYNSGGGTVTVNDSILKNNSASDGLGLGGGIYNGDGSVTVNNTILSGNSANGDWGQGGAIFNSSSLIVSNSIFSQNFARDSGVDIYNNADLTLNKNIIIGNNTGINPDIKSVEEPVFQVELNRPLLVKTPFVESFESSKVPINSVHDYTKTIALCVIPDSNVIRSTKSFEKSNKRNKNVVENDQNTTSCPDPTPVTKRLTGNTIE